MKGRVVAIACLVATSLPLGHAFGDGKKPPKPGISDPSDWDILITYPQGAQQKAGIRLRNGVIYPGMTKNAAGRAALDEQGRLRIPFRAHPNIASGEAVLEKVANGR